MDSFIIGILGVGVLLLLLVLGVPIAFSLAAVGLFGSAILGGFGPAAWMTTSLAYHLIGDAVIMVLPLFIFMGVTAGAGGISRDIYHALSLWLGRFRGGLGISTVFSCTAFGVVTGSSLVTAAVFSKVSAPEMRRLGYDKKMAYGICASAGSIGMLIPPSMLIVVYCIISEESIGRLLIAGIAPGLLLTVAFTIGIIVIGLINPASVGGGTVMPSVTWRQRIFSLRLLWPVFVVGTILIGGIVGGIFSPTEAAAFGLLVLLIILLITVGPERWKVLRTSIFDSISVSGMIFFILIGAGMFARFLMFSGISPLALGIIIGSGVSDLTFIIIMSFVYLVLGCFLDSVSMLSITLPIVIPVTQAMGIDPTYYAMVTVMAIEVGLVTPPVGLNVYGALGTAEPDVSLEDIFRGSFPFFLMMVVTLAVMIAFPWLSTILPELLFST